MCQGAKFHIHNGHPVTSEFVGVSWHEDRRSADKSGWRMDICKNGQRFYQQFGSTQDDELAAALAYNGKARELYGDKARVN